MGEEGFSSSEEQLMESVDMDVEEEEEADDISRDSISQSSGETVWGGGASEAGRVKRAVLVKVDSNTITSSSLRSSDFVSHLNS